MFAPAEEYICRSGEEERRKITKIRPRGKILRGEERERVNSVSSEGSRFFATDTAACSV